MNQEHPTHHNGYHASIVIGSVVALVGALVCAAALGRIPGLAGANGVFRTLFVGVGGLIAVVGAGYPLVRSMLHIWLRCPTCKALVRQESIDQHGAYYPCGTCGVTWTCPCTAGD